MKALLALALALITGAASAAPSMSVTAVPCMPAADVFSLLTEKYREQVIFMGSTEAGVLVTVTANPKTSSFSVIEVRGEIACILTVGHNAQRYEFSTTEKF